MAGAAGFAVLGAVLLVVLAIGVAIGRAVKRQQRLAALHAPLVDRCARSRQSRQAELTTDRFKINLNQREPAERGAAVRWSCGAADKSGGDGSDGRTVTLRPRRATAASARSRMRRERPTARSAGPRCRAWTTAARSAAESGCFCAGHVSSSGVQDRNRLGG